MIMLDDKSGVKIGKTYEAVEIGGDILLMLSPLDRERLARVEKLAKESIEEHR